MSQSADEAPSSDRRQGRRHRLRHETRIEHEALDSFVMGQGYFSSVARYGTFIAASHLFHRRLEDTLSGAGIAHDIEDWPQRVSSPTLAGDLGDLNLAPLDPGLAADAVLPMSNDIAEKLGALYVIEGSRLGARLLVLEAEKLGLSAERGARYLSRQAASLALWTSFLQKLETAPLDVAGEARCVTAARSTFACFRSLLRAADE